MSSAKVRRLRSGEERQFITSMRIPFLDPRTSAKEEKWEKRHMRALPVDRAWVAEDSGRFVGQCVVYTLDVTAPAPAGGAECPVVAMGGVSAVGVHPTHRRQGILTEMMGRMLEDCRERREPIAGLIASESVIYGRYGFGLASDHASYRIDRRDARMSVPAPALPGIRLLEKDEALKELPALHERLRRRRAGEPSRRESDWAELIADEPSHRGGGRGLFFASSDDGYVIYRAHESDWMHGARHDVVVEELRGATADAEAGLWQFVFDIDLVGEILAKSRPVDEPVRWRLADPRRFQQVSVEDRLYVRVLDVPAALEARGYQGSGGVTFEVVAPERDPAAGTWVLEAGPDGASCRRAGAGEEPGLRMDIAALGSLYLGGYRASLLAAGRRVEELRPGSLAVADRVFTTTPAPSTVTGF